METPTDPQERARIYARYRKAHATAKELKPLVDAMAAEDLANGRTISELAVETGMLPEVFRRKARKADVPVDPRYRERAERLRKMSERPVGGKEKTDGM
jgi:hypothetical protein